MLEKLFIKRGQMISFELLQFLEVNEIVKVALLSKRINKTIDKNKSIIIECDFYDQTQKIDEDKELSNVLSMVIGI